METIVLKNVVKHYANDPVAAIDDVTLNVREGEFLCLIGPSGCGKSTLLKLIAGLEEPSAGSVQRPAHIAMAFQLGALFPWLTVFENVALGLRTAGKSESAVRHAVVAELETMKIRAFEHKYPGELSGGQRQRVGIARALATDPAVLLLDEPFSALDPHTTAELHDDMLGIWRRTGKTIVLVSHLIEEAVSLGERVVLMKEGRIDAEFNITLPYPRRESEGFHRDVMKIRRQFFA